MLKNRVLFSVWWIPFRLKTRYQRFRGSKRGRGRRQGYAGGHCRRIGIRGL